MPINQKRYKLFLNGKGSPGLAPISYDVDSERDANAPTLADQWRQWRHEKLRLILLADEAIRAWEAEHKGQALKAAPDPSLDEQPAPEGVITPSILRRWIQERSGVDCVVTLDMTRRTFSVEPLHPEALGRAVRKVDD